MNIPLICTLLLCTSSIVFSQENNPLETVQYCNQKFNFCTNYPSSTLPFKAILNQGNGIVLRSDDGTSEVVIAGYAAANSINTEEAFWASFVQMGGEQHTPKIISSLFGEDFYECFFILGHHFTYHKSYYFAGHSVRLEIRVPISNPVHLKTLRDAIELDFGISEQRVGYRS